MEFHLWRNATVLLTIDDQKFLIDPMLGEKGSFGPFPWTEDTRSNPLVNLSFSGEELEKQLEEIDAVVVTHLHPDHWDAEAVKILDKNLPIICPKIIAETIAENGFINVIPITSSVSFNGVKLVLTQGKHGSGEIEEKMGTVNGFVFCTEKESIYFTGDTIWCDAVKLAITKHRPSYVVVAAGAATFALGEPVTMSVDQIKSLGDTFPEVSLIITHLEAVSPCTETRNFIRKEMVSNSSFVHYYIPEDGERLFLE
ncbi:MBL fold metallo-hydrolase [Echinicola sp. 20G]|uniref:MBL fold metallo-hydrolase n=1 Tax=Echinicola sp. 20G TaxID=2781961 RepID=UPI0019106922|nr:MBL fold metallo-hydrolase [Echinicola sp. 20G]